MDNEKTVRMSTVRDSKIRRLPVLLLLRFGILRCFFSPFLGGSRTYVRVSYFSLVLTFLYLLFLKLFFYFIEV